ncbi:MAG: family 16 glycoside hydrolase [Saprospiraceae bacterium]
MKKLLLFLPILLIAVIFACNRQTSTVQEYDYDRPHDPWVFRSVLDGQARMVTLALHDNMWAAYKTDNSSLYKVWKGGVNFDGAVYTTVHGPQPSSIGDAWFVNKYENPWLQITGDNTQPVKNVQYRGHAFNAGQVTLRYDLTLNDGSMVRVTERPEFKEKEGGQQGWERTFTTENVPAGTMIGLKTNVSSVATEGNVSTEGGKFTIENKGERKAKKLEALDLDGILKLASNSSTTFTNYFVKYPLFENENKVVGAEEEEERPLGYRLIARSDCKTCHNTFRKTIGPAYMDVAKRYRNNPDNVTMLVGKVINGGAGNWGEAAMSAHHDLGKEDATAMVDYIMSLDAEEEAEMVAMEETTTPAELEFSETGATVKDNDLLPGLYLKFFQTGQPYTKIADIKWDAKPQFQTIIPNVEATDGDLAEAGENFALDLIGYINIPKDNNYTFRLASDDGSRLTIGDQVVIDHDGLHGASEMDGEMALRKGYHPFRVQFFNHGGGKNIVLKWRSFDDNSFKAVPAAYFVHHKDEQKPSELVAGPLGGAKTKIPGDEMSLDGVHPSYTLTQARPETFTPKVGGMDFLSDGRLVLSTWDAEGAIYILDNVAQGDPTKITTKKIAKGLAEPLGIKVVDDEIYVLQKQELTKLVDTDGDDFIDEYQTISNAWRTSGNFHEFAFGLVYKDDHFYATLAIAIEPGGASTQPQIQDRGKAVKINKNTGALEFIGQGLRTPNGIGIGVDNEIFIADNQGDWLPSCKILHLQEGAFFGGRAVDFAGTEGLKMTNPVVWLPQDEIGNSPTTPILCQDGRYQGQMIHGEVTHGGVKRVFVEEIDGQYQGAVFRFIQGLEAGVNRMVYGPDGGLYVGGIGSTGNWRHNGTLWYGVQRLEYNDNPVFEMLAVRAKANGLEIEFTEPLAEGMGWDVGEYNVEQWWYEPTENYGGPKMDQEDLNVKFATVSADRKRVFLELDGMKKEHVLYVRLPNDWVSSNYNSIWSTEMWYTMNVIPTEAGTIAEAPAPLPMNTLTATEKADGWKLLFDGETTAGWKNYNKDGIGAAWKVKDGILYLDTSNKGTGKDDWQAGGGDIMTTEPYEDYILELEWKIGNCGNSGIIFNVHEVEGFEYVWQTGPEMQILDNTCHPDAKIVTHRAGDLYDMIETSLANVKPAGQWNKIRLVNNGNKMEHWQNGRKVVEYELLGEEWKAMVAKSKFNGWEKWGETSGGHIALQDHGDPVFFRNIKIKPLSNKQVQ